MWILAEQALQALVLVVVPIYMPFVFLIFVAVGLVGLFLEKPI